MTRWGGCLVAAALLAAISGAARAEDVLPLRRFTDSIGVNTHIDFRRDGYENFDTVARAIRYLGITHLRDSPGNDSDMIWWPRMAQATGAKFDAYIGETSPADMAVQLRRMSELARLGVLEFFEGGNEEDDDYPKKLGNTLAYTAQFQARVHAAARQAGLPAINMSFGAGWTAANDWHGNYDKVGDLSAVADYANAHTYPADLPGDTVRRLNADAKMAAASRPVIMTELGWDTGKTDPTEAAKYSLDGVFDAIREGDVKTYFYALFDDQSGRFGLMNADGSPKPAGRALHNLMQVMQDGGAAGGAAAPSPTVPDMPSSAHALRFRRMDGALLLVLWNEIRPTAATVPVTLRLDRPAASLRVFDPMAGTSPMQSGAGETLTLRLPDHPIVVEIADAAPAPRKAALPAAAVAEAASPPAGRKVPVLYLPAAVATLAPGGSAALRGIRVEDSWAAGNPGTLALNVLATGGAVAMRDGAGAKLPGSGSGTIHMAGTLAQINAALATLRFTAGSTPGPAAVTIDVWNQAGVQTTRPVPITIGGE